MRIFSRVHDVMACNENFGRYKKASAADGTHESLLTVLHGGTLSYDAVNNVSHIKGDFEKVSPTGL
jgi:hypothetical protein